MKKSENIDGNVQTKAEKTINTVIHLIFIVLCGVCLYSFLIIVGSSFQTQKDISLNGFSVIPQHFSLDSYKMILSNPTQLINSYAVTTIVTVIGTICGLWLVSTCGYVLSRKSYRYKSILAFYVFFTMLFNGGIVPSYILITKWLGIKDTILALILPTMVSAWYIILMKGFFQAIPDSLIESAKIDGAGELLIFVRIIIPISKPAFATIGLFYVLQYWNDWWLSLMYIDNNKLLQLQYMLMRILKNAEFLNSAAAIQYGMIKEGVEIPTQGLRMAMCVLAAGPILVVFPFFQKYFVKGLTVGAVKG